MYLLIIQKSKIKLLEIKQSTCYYSIAIFTGSNYYDVPIHYSDICSSYIEENRYLSQSFQGSDSNEVANSQICSQWSKQGEHRGTKDAKPQQELPSNSVCKISTWNLSNDIAIEKRTKDPSLSISIPRILFPLKRENKTQNTVSSKQFL